MRVLDYEGLRRLLIRSLEDAGLLVKVDEVLYVNELARVCEVFIQRPLDYAATRAKEAFEWRPENQATVNSVEDGGQTAAPEGVILHAAFHLHFDDLEVDSDVIREVTDSILSHATRLFGDSGAMVAELRMVSTGARIECLRYEVDVEAPHGGASVEWWHTWGAMCASLLNHFDDIHAELYSRYGPTA